MDDWTERSLRTAYEGLLVSGFIEEIRRQSARTAKAIGYPEERVSEFVDDFCSEFKKTLWESILEQYPKFVAEGNSLYPIDGYVERFSKGFLIGYLESCVETEPKRALALREATGLTDEEIFDGLKIPEFRRENLKRRMEEMAKGKRREVDISC